MSRSTDRGQAYTLEGVITAILIASALVLGVQAVDIQPFSGDGPEQGDALRVQVEDAIDIAADEGALHDAVTCVRNDDGTYIPDQRAASTTSAASLGTILNATLEETARYTIHVEYNDSNEFEREHITGQQTPIDSSVSVTRQFALFKSDGLSQYNTTEKRCVQTRETLSDRSDDLYLGEPASEDGELYNVVRVVVRAW